jgi:ribonuclease HI
MEKHFLLYTDGASRGNPGKSGIGFLVESEGCMILERAYYIGSNVSNNQAEYVALLAAILELKNLKYNLQNVRVVIHCDSLLVVRQLNRNYKVRNPGIQLLFDAIDKELKGVQWEIMHVYREFNKQADILANKGIDDEIKLPDYLSLCIELLRQINISTGNTERFTKDREFKS